MSKKSLVFHFQLVSLILPYLSRLYRLRSSCHGDVVLAGVEVETDASNRFGNTTLKRLPRPLKGLGRLAAHPAVHRFGQGLNQVKP